MGTPLETSYLFDPVSLSAGSGKLRLTEYFTLEILGLESEIATNELHSDHATLLPTLSLNGFLGTGFSTNNKDYTLSGNPTKPYSDQLNQNLYEGIGLSLSIPLFNRGEWFKTKQLNAIRQEEISEQKQLAGLSLEKRRAELLRKRLDCASRVEQLKKTVANLETIYSMSLLLYQEGRLSSMEIENILLEWQLKEAYLETASLNLVFLHLLE
jgi:outer membrane protein